MSEKIYQFNEYILSYDKGENDRSCLIISKCLLDKIYVMAELYDGSAELISTILDSLQQQVKKQQEVIDKAINILKDNFVYDYVRSCDTTDGVGYDEIDTEHFTYRVYELLKEVSE